jgi:hypothetical protein
MYMLSPRPYTTLCTSKNSGSSHCTRVTMGNKSIRRTRKSSASSAQQLSSFVNSANNSTKNRKGEFATELNLNVTESVLADSAKAIDDHKSRRLCKGAFATNDMRIFRCHCVQVFLSKIENSIDEIDLFKGGYIGTAFQLNTITNSPKNANTAQQRRQ